MSRIQKRRIRITVNTLENLSKAETRTQKLDAMEKAGIEVSRKTDSKKINKKFDAVIMEKMVIVQREVNRQKAQNKRRNLRNKRMRKTA
jgi:phage protein D